MTPTSDFESASSAVAAPKQRSGSPFLKRYKGVTIWLVVTGFMLFMLWPMLKGSYYRFSGTAAPEGGIPWRTDLAKALEESATTRKPVLIDFTASWCPPCQVMKHEVWPDGQVYASVVENYIPVLLDVDQPENAAASNHYGIRSIPTILIVNAEGDVRHVGSYMTRKQMLAFLEKGRAG